MILGTLGLRAQTIINAKVDQYPPLKAIAENVRVELPAGGITLGSDLSVEGGDGNYTFLWANADGQQLSTTRTVTITTPGDYFLRVSDSHDCQVSVKFTAVASDGIIALDAQTIRQLRLYDTTGKLIKQTQSLSTYTDGLHKGTYVLSILLTDGRQTVRKVIVK